MKKLLKKIFGKKRQKIWVVIEDIPEINDWNLLRVYGKKGCNIEVKFFNMSKENRDKATDAEMNRSYHNEWELKEVNSEVLWANPLNRY